MATHEYERPWQVMPAKIIKLALEHAAKEDDFDHQVAYLLLDIRVEAALKTYLINCGYNVERIAFPELLRKVKEELSKTNPEFAHQMDDIGYFHGIRNKLYHQGDGVKPTKSNLEQYSDLAREVVEEVIEVDIKTEEAKHLVDVRGFNRDVKNLVTYIENHFRYFRESCGIVAEKVRPMYATREFAMKLKFIFENWPDREEDEPEDRLENRKQRLDKFNELMENKQTSQGFVDYVLEDINHLYVITAFQQVSQEWEEDWNSYVELEKRRSWLLSDWKHALQRERLETDRVREEFEKIASWLKTQQEKVDAWIDTHLENTSRLWTPHPAIDFRDLLPRL